ncbi:MAG: SET domain-containing protein [Moorea sp. SIO4G2]|nr:SET domain-containing protein [Moorena sp. SIO4G2]
MINYLSHVSVVKTHNKGKGVFADKKFDVGEIVLVGKPVAKSPERTWQTLQLDINTHVRMDEPFELVNHSCDPNCGIKLNEFNGYSLVAMKEIIQGEEVTFDYCMSEWISIAVPNCNCQSNICRGSINGGKFLSDQILEKYRGLLAPYYAKLVNIQLSDQLK